VGALTPSQIDIPFLSGTFLSGIFGNLAGHLMEESFNTAELGTGKGGISRLLISLF